MKEIGQLLKDKRDSLKISLEEVAVSTKISVKILQALEEGDLAKLPAKPFVRGFIQSYSKFLGLDVKEILEKFQQAVGTTNPKTEIVLPETDNLEKQLPGSGRSIITGIAIVLVIIAIVVIQRVIAQREEEMRTGEIQAITGNDAPLEIKPQTSPTPDGSASPSPTADAAATPAAALATAAATAAATATPAPTPLPTATPKPTTTPTPTPAPTPKPTATPTATPAPTPAATPAAAATPVGPAATTPGAPQEIIIEALDHVTIKVTIDEKPAQEFTMNADQIQTFKAKNRIRIYTPNGGAVSIIQNGNELGVPGNLGQPKLMVYPP